MCYFISTVISKYSNVLQVVQIYDSIAGLADESKFLEAIKKYLIDEANKTHPDVADDLLDISTWSFKKSFREIDGKSVSVCTPQRTNSCDCGVSASFYQ